MTRVCLALALCGAIGLFVIGAPAAAEAPRAVTVPLTVDHNRVIVEVTFIRPDGTERKAPAWIDTGNENVILSEPLARDLGIELPAQQPGGGQLPMVPAAQTPAVSVGGLPLDVTGVLTKIFMGAHVLMGVPAEVNLPATLLRGNHVVFDYSAGRFTVARPGALQPRGAPVPCRVNPQTGLLMIDTTIEGEAVALGVDTGSAGTWVSDTLTAAWQTRHPDWPHAVGAAGSANFFGFAFEPQGALMRLPALTLGTVPARDVALLGLDQSFFDWYSRKSAGPVRGFLGGNVLSRFRLEIDYPNSMTYWEAGPATGPVDGDIVGLTLRPELDGGYAVAGVVMQDGRPVVDGVQPGDTLLRVGELAVAGATMGTVVGALRGEPGATRVLVVEREGKQLTVEAKVARLPGG